MRAWLLPKVNPEIKGLKKASQKLSQELSLKQNSREGLNASWPEGQLFSHRHTFHDD